MQVVRRLLVTVAAVAAIAAVPVGVVGWVPSGGNPVGGGACWTSPEPPSTMADPA